MRSEERPGENTIGRLLAECQEVLEVHHVAGDDCHLIKVRARDAEHLGLLLRTRFGRIPGVRSTRTTIVLETVKETFPAHEHDEFIPHYRGLLAAWSADQKVGS